MWFSRPRSRECVIFPHQWKFNYYHKILLKNTFFLWMELINQGMSTVLQCAKSSSVDFIWKTIFHEVFCLKLVCKRMYSYVHYFFKHYDQTLISLSTSVVFIFLSLEMHCSHCQTVQLSLPQQQYLARFLKTNNKSIYFNVRYIFSYNYISVQY